MRKLLMAFSLLALATGALAEEAQENAVEKKENKTSIASFTKEVGINPYEMRDPFKRNLPKRARLKRNLGNQYFNGEIYTNKDSIDGVPIEQLRVVGVLLGPNRRAIVKVVPLNFEERDDQKVVLTDAPSFVVKEGMKLGIDSAEVRAILPGGIVLVEKIKNVYDQYEYMETIIPVSE